MVTKLTEAQQNLAKEIYERIDESPENFQMDSWFDTEDPDRKIVTPDDNLCGTTLCLFGWAAYLSGYALIEVPGKDVHAVDLNGVSRKIEIVGKELLGLPNYHLAYVGKVRARANLKHMAEHREYHPELFYSAEFDTLD